eukprot:363412-Chlamydomonas_euryale.AAC.1
MGPGEEDERVSMALCTPTSHPPLTPYLLTLHTGPTSLHCSTPPHPCLRPSLVGAAVASFQLPRQPEDIHRAAPVATPPVAPPHHPDPTPQLTGMKLGNVHTRPHRTPNSSPRMTSASHLLLATCRTPTPSTPHATAHRRGARQQARVALDTCVALPTSQSLHIPHPPHRTPSAPFTLHTPCCSSPTWSLTTGACCRLRA